jgi:hypothetical protein
VARFQGLTFEDRRIGQPESTESKKTAHVTRLGNVSSGPVNRISRAIYLLIRRPT